MATVVTITSPSDNDAVTYPFTVTGTASPPGATVKLFNDVTGEVIGVGTSDGVTGAWSIVVTGAVVAMRAATVTPYGGSSQRRSSTTEGKKTATAQRSGKTTAQATGTARRSSKTDSVQGGVERRSETTHPAGGSAERRSAKTSANATSTARRSSYSDAKDATAPSVGTLTVPDTSGTSITGISASATDAIGVTGYMIKESATDSFTAPAAGDAGWTSVTSTTSYSSSALTFTSTATETGTRYFRIYFKDAAGNVGASATDSATITIASGGITYVNAGTTYYNNGLSNGSTFSPGLPSGTAQNDILLLFWGGGANANFGTPSGWAFAGATAQFSGGGFSNGSVFWKRAGASETAPTLTASGDDGEGPVATVNLARIFAFRGCPTSGSPIDVAATGYTSGSGTSVTGSSITTATANAMMVMIGANLGSQRDYSSPGGSVDAIVSGSSGGYGIFCAYDDAPSNSAGSKSAPTATQSSTGVAWTAITFALKPA